MNKEKIISYALAAFELTKMVLIITTNTTIKLVDVGKREVTKQYSDYKQGKRSIDFGPIKQLAEDVKRSLPAAKSDAGVAPAKPPAAKPPPPLPTPPKKK
ncbi:unnamed protein product [Acanthoscelides obtectus]|uniref:Uncharacterized protein n=1 Tax=Acanthoscelides obtectus TaxID=200917 RepID=A0A9P0P951_ACAOB|nr:unnamed protein product [Acanthoscelides obtectus]CAK1674928.1 hypothetical protein AOBTE_LOCUS29817 [Acanthoscelides obtectus]